MIWGNAFRRYVCLDKELNKQVKKLKNPYTSSAWIDTGTSFISGLLKGLTDMLKWFCGFMFC